MAADAWRPGPTEWDAARAMTATFLHVADCPLSIDVLLALRNGRDWADIGMTPEPNGLQVDWDALLGSYLSSSEKATVRLVQAVYPVEGKGGLPARVSNASIRALMEDLT